MTESNHTLVEAPPSPGRSLPEPVARRGITEAQWLTLTNTLFPGAASASVILVWDYCAARKLDPMKKPVHIVPMRVKDARSGEWGWRDIVMPGIYEYRITAHRTGLYLGHSEPEFGLEFDYKGVKAFEWCAMTFYRWNDKAAQKVSFPVKVYFREVVATKQDGTVNERWTRASIQMHTKCTEAAGLRETFPEEFGGEPTAEEMEDRTITTQAQDSNGMIDAEPVSPLDHVSQGLRENIEKAFETLNLAPGMRLAKLNEHLGAPGVEPDEGAQALLEWARDEFAKRKTGKARAKKGTGNEKAQPSATAKPTQEGPIERATNAGSIGTGRDRNAAEAPPPVEAPQSLAPAPPPDPPIVDTVDVLF